MGDYFLIVNPVKRQYLDPSRFGEGVKFSAVLRGDYCLHALKLLITDCFKTYGTSFPGAWLGDPVILTSFDAGVPNPAGLVTATSEEPDRNLNAMARQEFANISYRALAHLCHVPDTAAELANRAKENDGLLIDLGATLEQYRVPALEFALEAAVGRPWRKRYTQVQALTGRVPLPPIDWPL